MRNRKKLPIGIDSFEKIIQHNFYYVDKTEMITELLHNWGEVNLFTRPRRFGKSLNMNMLQSFLEIGCDKSLFNGLKVSREKELCEEYMGKFPVISLTLKNVEGLNFESARKSLKNTLGMEAWRLSALAESSRLTEEEKKEEFKGGGDRFFLGNPGYLIHDLQGDRINTHYQTIPTGADYSGPWPFKYYEGEED